MLLIVKNQNHYKNQVPIPHSQTRPPSLPLQTLTEHQKQRKKQSTATSEYQPPAAASAASEMGRSPCCEKAHTNKGAWTKGEDDRLVAYIRAHGEGCWRSLPKAAGLLRCGKSCRLRWMNYLRPDLKRGNFTEEEDEMIIKLHGLLGNKWSLIAGRLPGRTDNEIKNYWNTHIKRKLLSRGIDPASHRSIDNPSSSPDLHAAASATATISFSAPTKPTQELDHFNNHTSFVNVFSSKPEEQTRSSSIEPQDHCPDLNLELKISPPCPSSNPQQPLIETGAHRLCFSCSLGLRRGEECGCGVRNGSRGSVVMSSVGYDFLEIEIKN
uniref:Uncharacterized protein n=1 Tax=Kalanchoe fedtschenkoi TaxID=63787 RepID=A0A7N0T0K7_KALFE